MYYLAYSILTLAMIQLLLASLGDFSLEEPLVPVPVQHQLPLERLPEPGQHQLYRLWPALGDFLADCLRGYRESHGRP